ncbi:MAG: cohesin domain-containing protein [Bacillota bacterium]|nr:cohesin domain-containing protein [Bacillota bacterium]
MKKVTVTLIVFCMLLFSSTVFAEEVASVDVKVNGKIEQGQNIQILINVNNISSFFAGAVKLKYNNQIIKVNSIEKGDLISQSGINSFEALNKIDENNGTVEYGFSCLGKINGFSGSGNFLKINAQVLKKDSFHIKSIPFIKEPDDDNNLKIQLVNKDIQEQSYTFTGYDFKLNSDGTSNITNPSTAAANGSSTAGNSNLNGSNSKAASQGVTNAASDKENSSGNASKELQKPADNAKIKKGEDTKNNTLQKKSVIAASGGNQYNNVAILGIVSIALIIIAAVSYLVVIKRKKLSR